MTRTDDLRAAAHELKIELRKALGVNRLEAWMDRRPGQAKAVAVGCLVVVLVALVIGTLTGCSAGKDAATSAPPAPVPTSSAPVESNTPPPVEETPGLAAAEVLQAFAKAKLPVRHARNNSKNCESLQLGCLEMVTTDDVSVTTWGDSVAMETYAQAFGKDAFVLRNVVLLYAAAKTPAAARPRYQLVLTRLAG